MRHVFKLGGSLLNMPDLRQRVEQFISNSSDQWLLVVGGGAAADLVRQWDAEHALGDEASHWLAVRAMQFNTHLVLTLWPGALLVADEAQCAAAWRAGKLAAVDPLAWLLRERDLGIDIPHRWSFTSDSVAAHIAKRIGMCRLTLLKSTLPNDGCSFVEATAQGIVDDDFAAAASGIAEVSLVNLRQQPPGRCVLTATA